MNTAVMTLDSYAGLLWAGTAVTYVLGDILTTFVGLQYGQLRESGPVPALLLEEFGFGLLVGLKLGMVCLVVLVWRVLPRPVSIGIPLGLTLLGAGITLWNTALILVVFT